MGGRTTSASVKVTSTLINSVGPVSPCVQAGPTPKPMASAHVETERSVLPNVRVRAAEAAARWSEMADRLEWVGSKVA